MNLNMKRALINYKKLSVQERQIFDKEKTFVTISNKLRNGQKQINMGPTVILVCPHCGKPLYDTE